MALVKVHLWSLFICSRSGKCTPVDVAQKIVAAMEACEERNPKMRIFVQSNVDTIMEVYWHYINFEISEYLCHRDTCASYLFKHGSYECFTSKYIYHLGGG